jgi:hypothetical protein
VTWIRKRRPEKLTNRELFDRQMEMLKGFLQQRGHNQGAV